MHHHIDCVYRNGATFHIEDMYHDVDDNQIYARFGPSKALRRTAMNKYLSDYVHNSLKKRLFIVTVY